MEEASMAENSDSSRESFVFDSTQRVLIIVLGVIVLAILCVILWIAVLAICFYRSKKLVEESRKRLADMEEFEGNVKLVGVQSTLEESSFPSGKQGSKENTDTHHSQEDITLGTFGFPEITVEPISPPLEGGCRTEESTNVKETQKEVEQSKEIENDNVTTTTAKETLDKEESPSVTTNGEKQVTTDVPSENENIGLKKESTATVQETTDTNTDGKLEPVLLQVKQEGSQLNQIPILSNEDIERALGIFIPDLESENEITVL